MKPHIDWVQNQCEGPGVCVCGGVLLHRDLELKGACPLRAHLAAVKPALLT